MYVTTRPAPTYPEGKAPCRRCGILRSVPTGKRAENHRGLCKDCAGMRENRRKR
jgi:hypothetical protein